MNACTRTSAVATLIYLRSYISEVVQCPFNYIVDTKRHCYGVIENDADITRLICRLDDISSCFIDGSRGGSLNLEWRMRSFVLSLFSSTLLVVIRLVISTRQLSIREIVVVRSTLSSQLKVVYSWVTSAYRWNSIACHRIRSSSGAVYKRYSNEPNTDPWGTPSLSERTEEVNPSIWTD